MFYMAAILNIGCHFEKMTTMISDFPCFFAYWNGKPTTSKLILMYNVPGLDVRRRKSYIMAVKYLPIVKTISPNKVYLRVTLFIQCINFVLQII